MFSLLWHWSWLDRRAIIIIVLTTLCLIEFTHFSNERCIEVENRGKMHFGVPENVRCSKVYVVKCTFYWGLIYKDKEGKKRELAKMHLIARKTLYWGTLYQGSTVLFALFPIILLCCDHVVVRKMVCKIDQTKSQGQFSNQSSDGHWETCFHLFWYSDICNSNCRIIVQWHRLYFNVHLDLGKKQNWD